MCHITNYILQFGFALPAPLTVGWTSIQYFGVLYHLPVPVSCVWIHMLLRAKLYHDMSSPKVCTIRVLVNKLNKINMDGDFF